MSRPATLCVAGAEPPEAHQVPVALPIVHASTFVFDEALEAAMEHGDYRSQFLYARHGNPTVDALQRRLAALHGAEDAVCFASGMAAISTALITLTQTRRAVVADTVLYGAATTFLAEYLQGMGRVVRFVDFDDAAALEAELGGHDAVGVVYAETISNPLVRVLDLPRVAAAARRAGAHLVVDNTFASPLLCRPLAHGADVVIESLTKSVSGHSDVMGGMVAGAHSAIGPVWHAMIHLGGCLDAHAAYLVWRGLKTLALRTDAAQRNARALAVALRAHPDVERLYAVDPVPPWLDGAGAMFAFVVRGGDARAQRFLRALQVVTAATSLGGVESLASLPFNTSHRTPQAQAQVGLLPGTVRFSAGCEDVGDLVADVQTALAQSRG